MAGTLELEGRMQYAKRGSPKFDAEIGRIVRPGAQVFFDVREPYWEPPDTPDAERVPRFSRAIEARVPWENIVEIEAFAGSPPFWRAVQQGNFEAIALTEALARRLAAIRAIRQREPAQPIGSTGEFGPALSLFVLRCIEDLELSADVAARVRTIVGYFIEVNGDLPIARYGRSHVWTFLRVARRKPVGYTKHYRNLSLMKLIEKADSDPDISRISYKTVNGYLNYIYLVFKHARNLDYRPDNPASRMKIRKKTGLRSNWRPFDTSDLKILFEASPVFKGCASKGRRTEPGEIVFWDDLFWLPLLGLYTGARLGELLSLRVDNFKHFKNIIYLDLTKHERPTSRKTTSAYRLIPVHPQLLSCGLLPFRNELIKRGSKHLFPRLCSPDRSAIGKWSGKWSKYRIRLGITDPRKTFHSFRHTFKRACQLAGIPEEVHVALMGHATGRRRGATVGKCRSRCCTERSRRSRTRISISRISISRCAAIR